MQNRFFAPKSPIGQQNLQFLTEHFHLDYLSYDVICGYRAKDSYFSFASDFLENIIPIQSLATSMKLGSLGMQVVLKSEKAFASLNYIGAVAAQKDKYYSKYRERDTAARKAFLASDVPTQLLRTQQPNHFTPKLNIGAEWSSPFANGN